MFRGRYEHAIDEKGRVAIPSRFRDALGCNEERSSLIVTNYDRCLVAYPQQEWEDLETRFAKLPQFDPKVVAFQRYFISGAIECSIDKAGRILIPAHLRQFAKIDKDCVFAGAIKKFEIWSQSTWDEEFGAITDSFSNLAESIAGLGVAL